MPSTLEEQLVSTESNQSQYQIDLHPLSILYHRVSQYAWMQEASLHVHRYYLLPSQHVKEELAWTHYKLNIIKKVHQIKFVEASHLAKDANKASSFQQIIKEQKYKGWTKNSVRIDETRT